MTVNRYPPVIRWVAPRKSKMDQPTEAEVNQAIIVAGEVRDLYEAGDRMPWLPVLNAIVAARRPKSDPVLRKRWQERGLSWRAARLLAMANLKTDEEVRRFGSRALFLMPSGGRQTVDEIAAVIEGLGNINEP